MQLTLRTVIVVSYAHQSKNLGCYWKEIHNTNFKSQLQTVLITASGPQALNALAHRVRYTQGSRQIRCVSSQEALALRAKVGGHGVRKVSRRGAPFPSSVLASGLALATLSGVHLLRPKGYRTLGRFLRRFIVRPPPLRHGRPLRSTSRHRYRGCSPKPPPPLRPLAGFGGVCVGVARGWREAKDCHLRTAYGGESNCIIKT